MAPVKEALLLFLSIFKFLYGGSRSGCGAV